MKVAARFPVKTSKVLLTVILLLHLGFLLAAAFQFAFDWHFAVILFLILIFLWLNLRRYRLLTSAPDDLCWSGENWLMNDESAAKKLVYLQLLPTSWLSRYACLLHFSCDDKKFSWLFTRAGLGVRSYSQLIYLARQSFLAQQKQKAQAEKLKLK